MARLNRVAGRTHTQHRPSPNGSRDEAVRIEAPRAGRVRDAWTATKNATGVPGSSAQQRGTPARGTRRSPAAIEEPDGADTHRDHEIHPAGDTGQLATAAPATTALAGLAHQILLTPEQAGALLAVPGSWLRVRAAAGQVPSRRLGKHLRFARADLDTIARAAARPATLPHQATGSPTTPSGVERRGPRRRVS